MKQLLFKDIIIIHKCTHIWIHIQKDIMQIQLDGPGKDDPPHP
jgi:hypothetical protein